MSRQTELPAEAAEKLSPAILALMNNARARAAADGRMDRKGAVHSTAARARYADAIAHLGYPEDWSMADHEEAKAAWISCGCAS